MRKSRNHPSKNNNCGVNSNRRFQTVSLAKSLENDYLRTRMAEAEERRLKRMAAEDKRKKVLAEIEEMRGKPTPK